jgi:acid phosphatase type 7
MSSRRRLILLVAVTTGLGVFAAALFASSTRADERAPLGAAATKPRTLIAAGDIASCGSDLDEATARLLDRLPGVIATLGDNAYESGTRGEFARCFRPTWGRHRARIRPAPGNHDYESPDATPYYEYFGRLAGQSGRGYYSYDVGAWHVISLNSNCDDIGGCHRGSLQERWLRDDLRAHRNTCTLAYWHHPRFSSGDHGDHEEMSGLWETLYRARADVILSGHDHNYERFAPQRPTGVLDRRRGLRQFVVGTGGARLRPFESPARNSQVRNSDTHGVLVLTLRPKGYSWRFVPVAGKRFVDSGSGACH